MDFLKLKIKCYFIVGVVLLLLGVTHTMSPQVTRITKPVEMGEGPHWDNETQALYFINMHYSEIHRYLPQDNLHTSAIVEGIDGSKKPVTFVVPVENQRGTFLIGWGGDLATVEWNGFSKNTKNFKFVTKLEERFPKVRLNDGKASPSGVIFAGSMGVRQDDGSFPPSDGKLFAYKDEIKVLLEGVGIANGLAWSEDEKTFYFIDSLDSQIMAFDYDNKTISISNGRPVYDLKEGNVFDSPAVINDGMTIDTCGNLWVAVIGSGKVYQINPQTKTVIRTIEFPCTQVTSVAFGGPKLEDLYVTSAYLDITEEQKKKQPDAGCLFKVTGLGAKGFAGVRVKLQ